MELKKHDLYRTEHGITNVTSSMQNVLFSPQWAKPEQWGNDSFLGSEICVKKIGVKGILTFRPVVGYAVPSKPEARCRVLIYVDRQPTANTNTVDIVVDSLAQNAGLSKVLGWRTIDNTKRYDILADETFCMSKGKMIPLTSVEVAKSNGKVWGSMPDLFTTTVANRTWEGALLVNPQSETKVYGSPAALPTVYWPSGSYWGIAGDIIPATGVTTLQMGLLGSVEQHMLLGNNSGNARILVADAQKKIRRDLEDPMYLKAQDVDVTHGYLPKYPGVGEEEEGIQTEVDTNSTSTLSNTWTGETKMFEFYMDTDFIISIKDRAIGLFGSNVPKIQLWWDFTPENVGGLNRQVAFAEYSSRLRFTDA